MTKQNKQASESGYDDGYYNGRYDNYELHGTQERREYRDGFVAGMKRWLDELKLRKNHTNE